MTPRILTNPILADRLKLMIHRVKFPRSVVVLFALALMLSAFAWALGPPTTRADFRPAGAVYALTNVAAGNAVAVFNRAANGTLTPAGLVPTGGLGIGDQADAEGLGSQGALALSSAGHSLFRGTRWLFAVNGGSRDISVFAVTDSGLTLVDRVPSHGPRPISLTVFGNLLYVLNFNRQAGGEGNITGFTIGRDGHLRPLPGSTRPLSARDADPGEVQFSPNGNLLAVTEKATSRIVTYKVGSDGLPGNPMANAAAAIAPFALAFGRRNVLITADDFFDADGQAAASSYIVSDDGTLRLMSGPVHNTQTAACWVAITGFGNYAYVANTNSGTLTGYGISFEGNLRLLNDDGITAVIGAGTKVRDLALSDDSRFLYSLNSAAGTVSAFQVRANGSLRLLDVAGGIPAPGSNGLAAR